MNQIPAAALAVIRAAVADYQLATAPTAAPPTDVAQQIAEYLIPSGYTAQRHSAQSRPYWRRREFPAEAVAEIRTAPGLHCLLGDTHLDTPAVHAAFIAAELTAADWTITPNTRTRSAA
ncbi:MULTISPECIES: hypothetical protein [Streptomyces]|uniref:Uncharacterized protein n=1 Tax=Streptomyces celluloflavus TaxID=58344 RepID=A0ABW7RH80_9ACTN|nr:hypothetical protein [Streptomyces kasugaensis]